MQKVLVLGAGLVAKPLVEYLLSNGFHIEIACNTVESAKKILNNHPSGTVSYWEAGDKEMLDRLVSECSLAVSLLPYSFHPIVARACLKHLKPMVTTSYVKDEMAGFDSEAREKGILFLNEIGLDPGIDHMSAMRIIDNVHLNGGKITKFYSICGALPAPENADNPMKYKFSWSPKGVILASRNSALYKKEGRRIEVGSPDLFKDRFTYEFPGVGPLEVYPNRDSISYIDIYGIPETDTIFRGTFRFAGWCETLDAMKELKMLDDTTSDYTGRSYLDFIEGLVPGAGSDPEGRVAEYLGIEINSPAMESFRWLGLFSDSIMNYGITSPFEIISDLMISRMMLGNNEKDMIVLQHLFMASYPDGRNEVISSHMIDYGSPSSNTSVARTVGLPAAIAVKLILEGKIDLKGVHRPVLAQIYNPVLDELEKMDIRMIEEYGLPEQMMIG